MKLVFLCHGAGNGGAERAITTIANEMSYKGHQVELITTSRPKNGYYLDEKIIHKVICYDKMNVIIRSIKRVFLVRKELKIYKPDCLISFSTVSNLQAILASLGLKHRVIISERSDPNQYPSNKLGKMIRNLLYPFANKIVFQTEDARDYFKESIKKKGSIILNPISKKMPEPYIGKREKRIVGVGSLIESKNWECFLAAASMFLENYPDYTVDIYGDGDKREKLLSIIQNDVNLNGKVNLRGFSASIWDDIKQAGMYISSSNFEGISNAMIEAMALGIPTICTDCPIGGAKMIISHNENGILVPINNSFEIFQNMQRIASSQEFSQKLSKNAIKIRELLNIDAIVCRWEEEIAGDK